MIAVAFIS